VNISQKTRKKRNIWQQHREHTELQDEKSRGVYERW